jgi:hypothetical protein
LRLFWHRLRPHWLTLKRVMRIGIPSGIQGVLQWFANFGVVIVVNKMPDARRRGAHQRHPRREHQQHERLCRRHSGTQRWSARASV